jgi:hypothetical protein
MIKPLAILSYLFFGIYEQFVNITFGQYQGFPGLDMGVNSGHIKTPGIGAGTDSNVPAGTAYFFRPETIKPPKTYTSIRHFREIHHRGTEDSVGLKITAEVPEQKVTAVGFHAAEGFRIEVIVPGNPDIADPHVFNIAHAPGIIPILEYWRPAVTGRIQVERPGMAAPPDVVYLNIPDQGSDTEDTHEGMTGLGIHPVDKDVLNGAVDQIDGLIPSMGIVGIQGDKIVIGGAGGGGP